MLVGDVLEFALMSASVAGMVFDEFVAQAFAPGNRRFAPTVYYVPGNHDHHLWEQLRERREALRIGATPPGVRLERRAPRVTARRATTTTPTVDQLLAMLIQRRPGCEDVQVVTAYPNLGLRAEEGDRVAVFHHGHFVEGIYRLVSSVKSVVFPDHAPGARRARLGGREPRVDRLLLVDARPVGRGRRRHHAHLRDAGAPRRDRRAHRAARRRGRRPDPRRGRARPPRRRADRRDASSATSPASAPTASGTRRACR